MGISVDPRFFIREIRTVMMWCRTSWSELKYFSNFVVQFFISRILGSMGEKDGGFDGDPIGAEFFCKLLKATAGRDYIVYYYDFFADDFRRYYYV